MKRIPLAQKPTPLEPLLRLSERLNINLWIKRDDLTGDMVTGGNKIRKLEYIFADAKAKGADTILTTGGPQSNHAKTTAALAKKLGFDPVLLLAGKPPEKPTANLLINELIGARIQFFFPRYPREMDEALEKLAEELRQEGRKPYIIPVGGSNGIGSLGYYDAYLEMDEQRKEKGIAFDWEVVTAGSGGTFAGILLGHQAVQSASQLLGISPWLSSADIKQRIIECAEQALPIMEPPLASVQAPLPENLNVSDAYIGKGYGKPTESGIQAIKLMASEESILLDHVYTAKAFSGLIDMIENGTISPGSNVLFWHTGGAPGLFAL